MNIEFTPNEFKKMNEYQNIYRISVLTNALAKNSLLSIFSYSPENNQWEDDNGKQLIREEVVSAKMSV